MSRAIDNLKKISRLANATAGMCPRREHSTACHNIKTIADAIIEEHEQLRTPELRNVDRGLRAGWHQPGTGRD